MRKAIQCLRSLRPDGPTSGTVSFAVMDFLTNHLSSEDNAYRRCICGRLELLGLIEDYRKGLLPLIVSFT